MLKTFVSPTLFGGKVYEKDHTYDLDEKTIAGLADSVREPEDGDVNTVEQVSENVPEVQDNPADRGAVDEGQTPADQPEETAANESNDQQVTEQPADSPVEHPSEADEKDMDAPKNKMVEGAAKKK